MKRFFCCKLPAIMIAAALCGFQSAAAQQADETAQAVPQSDGAADLQGQVDALRELVTALQNQVGQQSTLLAQQSNLLDQQSTQLNQQSMQLSRQSDALQQHQQQLDAQTTAIRTLQTRVDQTGPREDSGQLSTAERSARSQLESTLATGDVAEQETTTTYNAEEFNGAFTVPGTTAALRIGGFVKSNFVQSFSGLGSQNRFIVGTIPTRGPVGTDTEAALTAQQSRLNFELRENTDYGQVRAFVEGDFAGAGDTFRLRHAFGQFRDFLIGKTWSTFMDVDSAPEEVDFEGINGRINIRQPQIRWFPAVGNNYNLELALEDPAPDITGGTGVSQVPDFVASIRTNAPRILFSKDWQFKSSLLLRSIRGRWALDPEEKRRENGWGLSLSGRRPILRWDARDSFAMQISYGDGYGRYINDLGTVGGQDAVFDDVTGELATLKALSTYASFQKWWNQSMRSTFIVSYVDVKNTDFQPGDAYDRTIRLSGNLIWSPVPRIDIAGELLWGRRADKDGSRGDASQFQISTRYRF